MNKFDELIKGYKNYLAYCVSVIVIFILYFGDGTDLDSIAVIVGSVATLFGIFARASQK